MSSPPQWTTRLSGRRAIARPPLPQLAGTQRAELADPASDGFVGQARPRSASMSSTSRRLSVNRRYSQTTCWMMPAGIDGRGTESATWLLQPRMNNLHTFDI